MADFLELLNEAQRQPVLDTEGAVLVLAGAGSGKTRVLTSRIAYLVRDKQVAPWNILAITFTNKAANEMKERIAGIADSSGMWVCTIHSMCTRILRENANIERLGYTRDFTIYAEQEKKNTVKKLFEAKGIDDEKLLKKALWVISDAKSRHISPDQFAQVYLDLNGADTISEIYEGYEAAMKCSNALDFDDILTKTFDLFKNCSDVLEHYQEKFRYIHIDEFQDTNEIQMILAKALCYKHGNIFAVGDDDQSIYGWRGAEIKNILDFKESFPQAKIYKLEQNYRSSKRILEAANRIIQYNMQRMEKSLWTQNSDGVKIETFSGGDENQEAYYVANQISSLVHYHGYKYSDFGVLMRVNALTRVFEQEFLKYNISYQVFGGFKFYERKEIKDILAYLRILTNPFDNDAVRRVINVPKRGIGEAAVKQLEADAAVKGISLSQAVADLDNNPSLSAATARKIEKFRDIIVKLSEAMDYYELSEFVEVVIKETDLLSQYASESEEDVAKRLNVEEFVNSVQQFAKENEGASLSDFLQSVTLASDIDEADESESRVTLATIHSVKGLEFRVVFVVGLDDGIFPLSRAKETPSELEEERRLMYVAITRARERLYITRASSRYLYGKREYTMRSQFLDELDLMPESKKLENFLRGETAAEKPSYAPDVTGFLKKQVEKEPMKDMTGFRSGVKVLHKTFGEGTVLEVSGEGLSTMLTVMFKGLGVKNLSAQMAPITIID